MKKTIENRKNEWLQPHITKKMNTFVSNEKKRQSKERMVTFSHDKKMDTFVYNEDKITRIEKANGYSLTSQKEWIYSFIINKNNENRKSEWLPTHITKKWINSFTMKKK